MSEKTDRRSFLNKGLLGAAGVGAAYSMEEHILLAAMQGEAGKKETPKPDIAPGSLPCGKIGNVTISRLLLGGNLIGGFAHSRDLLYVSSLFKAYNTESRIFQTLELAQLCGINTILIDPHDWDVVLKYNQSRATKLQTMLGFRLETDPVKMLDGIKRLTDKGATLLYPHGMQTDETVRAGNVEVIGKAIEMVKAQGIPAGVGSHSLETPIACEKHKFNPDFYVKTFHMDRYWSATPKEKREEWCWYTGGGGGHDGYCDNIWCIDPEKTEAFMATVEKPWVAFKVMAAGAISPRDAFPFAYRHGADFIVAGMFDFQIESDVKIAIESLQKVGSRKRPWRG